MLQGVSSPSARTPALPAFQVAGPLRPPWLELARGTCRLFPPPAAPSSPPRLSSRAFQQAFPQPRASGPAPSVLVIFTPGSEKAGIRAARLPLLPPVHARHPCSVRRQNSMLCSQLY